MSKVRSNPKKERILEVFYGGDVPKKIPDIADRIAECLANPKNMYLHIGTIVNDPVLQDMRIHLARVQIDSELHLRDEVDYYTQRLWAAQTMERMIFGGLLVEGEKVIDDDD